MSHRHRSILSRAFTRPDLLVLALVFALGASFAVARAAPPVEASAAAPAELPGLATDPIVGFRGSTRQAGLDLFGPPPFPFCPGYDEVSLLLGQGWAWLAFSPGWRVDSRTFGGDAGGAEGGEIDWTGLKAALDEIRTLPVMAGRTDVELAATDDASYFTVLEALAVLHEAGFTTVKFGEPHQLSSALGPAPAYTATAGAGASGR